MLSCISVFSRSIFIFFTSIIITIIALLLFFIIIVFHNIIRLFITIVVKITITIVILILINLIILIILILIIIGKPFSGLFCQAAAQVLSAAAEMRAWTIDNIISNI